MPALEVEERQDSPLLFCCQFAAKISAILVLLSAFACIPLHIVILAEYPVFMRFGSIFRVATLTGFEPVLPP